jgi:hypothetical protein
MAATAAEARFRISGPDLPPRATRVIALDEGAVAVISRAAEQRWEGARFFTYEPGSPVLDGDGASPDIILRAPDGSQARLSEELAGADVIVMVATADDGAEAASVVGEVCTRMAIMTTGLVIGQGRAAEAAVSALRRHARVLVVSADEDDVPDVLTALRA